MPSQDKGLAHAQFIIQEGAAHAQSRQRSCTCPVFIIQEGAAHAHAVQDILKEGVPHTQFRKVLHIPKVLHLPSSRHTCVAHAQFKTYFKESVAHA